MEVSANVPNTDILLTASSDRVSGRALPSTGAIEKDVIAVYVPRFVLTNIYCLSHTMACDHFLAL